MEDTGIIDLYFSRDESAIRETDQKYGHYCYTVAWNILFDNEDSQECVNDTWRKTWELIPPQRPKLLKFFLAKITRGFAMNRLRANTREKRGGGKYETALEELENVLSTVGKSFSEPVLKSDGSVDADASRRVEILFRLRDEEMIREMMEILNEKSTGR